MKFNRTHPQEHVSSSTFESSEISSTGRAGCRCSSRRALCISAGLFCCIGLGVLGVGVTLLLSISTTPASTRDCRTAENASGFMCDDKVTCIPPSDLCNGVSNCPNGADEDAITCSDLPNHLPSNLIFRCGNPRFWIFSDKKCNNMNDCGDCSDETGVYASCPSCAGDWWSCTPTDFHFCTCVPRHACKDGRQHCWDWSDEYICPKS